MSEVVKEALVLVLVLFTGGGDGDGEMARVFAEDLQRQAGERVEVVSGQEAAARLEEYGISRQDLLASPRLGRQLTRTGDAVFILVDAHGVQGDQVLEGQLWFDGRHERHTVIAGAGADPVPAFVRGVTDLLGEGIASGGSAPEASDKPHLALSTLVQREEWIQVLGRLAGQEEPSVRESYYRVLAYVNLARRDAAVEALNAMRARHGDHILVTAAAELIPPAHAADDGQDALPDLPESDTLSDGAIEDAAASPLQDGPRRPQEPEGPAGKEGDGPTVTPDDAAVDSAADAEPSADDPDAEPSADDPDASPPAE
ncbi:MAG: hypothetical protein ACOCYV_01980 [Planctomycetota bacterium]